MVPASARTVAGVLVASTIPASPPTDGPALLERLEHLDRQAAARQQAQCFVVQRWRHVGGLYQGEAVWRMRCVGKGAAGRELDGRTWDEFPRVRP